MLGALGYTDREAATEVITDRHLRIIPSQFVPAKMFINDADTPGFQERQADFVSHS